MDQLHRFLDLVGVPRKDLYPLLFLIIAKGFGRDLLIARSVGDLTCISFWGNICLTHILFVNEVLVFSNGSPQEMEKIQEILNNFCKASSIKVNFGKLDILMMSLDDLQTINNKYFFLRIL